MTAPTFTSISISPTSGETPATFTVTINGLTDDVSGFRSGYVEFTDLTTNRSLSTEWFYDDGHNSTYENNVLTAKVSIDQYKPSGTYVIDCIYLCDKADNGNTWYGLGSSYYKHADESKKLSVELSKLSYTLINNGRIPDVITSTSNTELINQC